MSSAAASPAPRPPGSSRAAACRGAARDAARCARPPPIRPDNSPNSSARTRSAPTMPKASAIGLLHAEMRRLGSLVMRAADANKVPAGGALAVDRDGFAGRDHRGAGSRSADRNSPRGNRRAAAATGTASSSPPAPSPRRRWPTTIRALTGEDALAFFDAIAPIVHRDSIDMDVAWFQSRYDKAGPGGSGADYINCPLTREQYDAFIDALLARRKDRVPRVGERRRPISTAACRSR